MKTLTDFADWVQQYFPPFYLAEHPPRTWYWRLAAAVAFLPWMLVWMFTFALGGLPFIAADLIRWVLRG